MNSLIIGMGEIGKGLYKATNAYCITHTYDITDVDMIPQIKPDVLNICLPGNLVDFLNIVRDYMEFYRPGVTIIHSTVPVGTTRSLQYTTGLPIVHSPIRGVHWKSMAEGISTYIKYIGATSKVAGKEAEIFFRVCNIKYKTFDKPETTELGKILSTTDFGINLMFAQMKKDLCDELDLDYDEVVYDFTKTYNDGILATGEQFRKQLLTPPGDTIGGHCVVENAYMLLKTLYPTGSNWSLREELKKLVKKHQGERGLL